MSTKSSQSTLQIRQAVFSDLKAIIAIALPLVTHDGFHDFFFPFQDEFPGDFAQWWTAYFRNLILNPYVAVLVLEDIESERIIGVAAWSFDPRSWSDDVKPGDPKPRGIALAKDSWYERLARTYYGFKDKMLEKWSPNRAMDRSTLAEWGKTLAELRRTVWFGADRVNWNNFELLVPSEDRDIGFLPLLHWGFEQAEIDGISCFGGAARDDELKEYEDAGMSKVKDFQCGPSHLWIVKQDK